MAPRRDETHFDPWAMAARGCALEIHGDSRTVATCQGNAAQLMGDVASQVGALGEHFRQCGQRMQRVSPS